MLDFGVDYTPEKLRTTMVALKNRTSKNACCPSVEWLGRFDQQETIQFHRDNAAAQSVLMLGFEPTLVKNLLFLA